MNALRSVLLASTLLIASNSRADDCPIRWIDGYVPLAPPGATMWAGYGTLRNDGSAPVRIERIGSPQFGDVSLHETRIEDGVARMRELGPVDVPAHGELLFAPGGRHLMLMDPSSTPAAGASIDLAITADGCATPVAAKLQVRGADAAEPPSHAH